MGFYADLHVHSRYSRATSRDADLEHLSYWARRKGITVVGTGDFTHPAWRREIEEKLVPAEPGLFRLKPELEALVSSWPGNRGGEPTRFLLEVEISTIYKKAGATRKVHHLIYAPDLDKARNLVVALEKIGNLASDGRPILGLDSRDLLEITLASGDGSYLIPAHIWTPWFAALGSKSGFDSIDDCYGDLAPHIFAVETGLSSDPPMNWRLSRLDRYTLVSSSDAHSPPKLGREACVFETELDYFALRRALETGVGYGGTVEFFPEEGKYHMDGHRACGVRLEPEASREKGDLCPVCGKELTLGVLHRVEELADRPDGASPPRPVRFRSLVPLDEVLGEIEGAGPKSKAVQQGYDRVLEKVGAELYVLEQAPLDDVARHGSSALAEALSRMREGRVIREGGYDGEYGTIRLFAPGELERHAGERSIFGMLGLEETAAAAKAPRRRQPKPVGPALETESCPEPLPVATVRVASGILDALDPEQRAAAEVVGGPLAIIAGPGTGKTRTLTHRLAHLIGDHGVAPERCLAITFTRRAARELAERLERLLGERGRAVQVQTFHALGLALLTEDGARLGLDLPPRIAGEEERQAAAGQPAARISRLKRAAAAGLEAVGAEDRDRLALYDEALRARGLIDFDDLILLPLRLLGEHEDLARKHRERWASISVDEFQDIDPPQYALVRRLAPQDGDICVIGDPDQSIYGFRGADARCFERFREDFTTARVVHLTRSYRSTRAIVDGALEVVAPASSLRGRRLEASASGPERIEIHACASDRAEAELIVHSIERLLGGSALFSIDSGRVAAHEGEVLSFADVAVLYRTDAQADALGEAFARSGMPFQRCSQGPFVERPAVQALLEALASGQPGGLDRALAAAPAELQLHVETMRQIAAACDGDAARVRAELMLLDEADLWDPRAERVSLMTLHAAKGLEFPVVFIAGCEDGILPLRFGAANDADLAEERRLLFVGMTRAGRRLAITHARKRQWRGKLQAMEPSPFLRDIAERLLSRQEHRAEAKPASPYRQLTFFGE